jgi:hypothetical protein
MVAAISGGLLADVAPDRYGAFQATYRDDPAGFARDCIEWSADEGLADYQAEVPDALVAYRRVSVRAPHAFRPSPSCGSL